MSSIKRGWIAAAALAAVVAGSQLIPASAQADPEAPPQPDPALQGDQEVLHNIIYRARVDGVSRGAIDHVRGRRRPDTDRQPNDGPGPRI